MKGRFFLVFISLIFIIFVIYKNIERVSYLSKDTDIAIGKINEFRLGASVNSWLNYTFYVKNKKIEGKYNILEGMNSKTLKYYRGLVGKFFYVEYSRKKPNYNKLDLNKPVPDSLIIYFSNSTVLSNSR